MYARLFHKRIEDSGKTGIGPMSQLVGASWYLPLKSEYLMPDYLSSVEDTAGRIFDGPGSGFKIRDPRK
jgi:hypothetical protein